MPQKKSKDKSADKKKHSTNDELIFPDISFPLVMQQIRKLPQRDYEDFEKSIAKLKTMTWQQIWDTSTNNPKFKRGFNWELIDDVTVDGEKVASIRITEKFRARVSRKGVVMRFISLHPDHDSAYV